VTSRVWLAAVLITLALAACDSSGKHSPSENAPVPAPPATSAEGAQLSMGPVVFETGGPQRLDRFSPLPLSSEDEYRQTILPLKDRLVPIHIEPADLRHPAWYGFNVILDGSNRSFIIDGDEQSGYRLFVDLDGDGDLRERPLVTLLPTMARTPSSWNRLPTIQHPRP
jgi:hypothetical protein